MGLPFNGASIALLRKYGIALLCPDSVEWPLLMDVTTNFIDCPPPENGRRPGGTARARGR
jgi:hypothetical protein